MPELTPMMRQYKSIKAQHSDCILFFRLGDFYEMFDDDARLVSKELDLMLTTRDRSKPDPEDRVPMCGVPYHSAESYIARLLAKGYKVAICEQLEDPALAKGLVDRDVVRIVTPGTVLESSMLEEGASNYLCSVCSDAGGAAVCFADISTGEICATSFPASDIHKLINEVNRFAPSEAVLDSGEASAQAGEFLSSRLNCLVQTDDTLFDYMQSAVRVCRQFGVEDINALGLDGDDAAVRAIGGLLSYIEQTQKTDVSHINKLDFYSEGRYMELDIQTVRGLELSCTLRTQDKKGSLLWVLDKTKTPMGSRLLRSWLARPLLNPAAINRRSAAVSELFGETVMRSEIIAALRNIGDLERVTARIVAGTANCRDLVALAASAGALPTLAKLLAPTKGAMLSELKELDTLDDIKALIDSAIVDEPPFSVREGGFIRSGYNAEVDELTSLLENSKEILADIESRERARTGKKIRIGFNRVFGYYIDIPRSQSADVPADYVRKQTLANSERFITEELSELESKLLSAKDRLATLEYELFEDVRAKITERMLRIQSSAAAVAAIDVLSSFAETAAKNNYCLPVVDMSDALEIRDGRHPVVELTQTDTFFVPNDVDLDSEYCRTAIITGPNMAGKSTYMRQTALIVLMAQMGSFVPAKSAHIGVVDRVFTRIGASDDLSAGKSTFMVEMTEVAEILKNATRRSLIILDEIGRGTSTYDGMAIARAVLEHCADSKKLGAKTLFATHYHELAELEGIIPGVKNFNIAAKKRGKDIIFLRKIVPGGTDDSYGIEVAGLAGVPDGVIRRAKDILADTVASHPVRLARGAKAAADDADSQVSFDDMSGSRVIENLRATDINSITPIEAMNLLYSLKKEADGQ